MLTEYEQSIVDNVAAYGWQCITVVDPDECQPSFSYSIGLWETLGAPELIVFGLDSGLMHRMLSLMFEQLETGVPLQDGSRWSGLLQDFDCISRPVHPSQVKTDYFNSALWYRRHRTGDSAISAFQIFWPGAVDGLFPWEKDADEIVRDLQPPLYLPDEPGNA